MADDWEITTGDGGVSLYLPSDFGAELDAHTGDGTIRNDLDVEWRAGPSARTARRTVRGQPRRRRPAASHPHRRRRDPTAETS